MNQPIQQLTEKYGINGLIEAQGVFSPAPAPNRRRPTRTFNQLVREFERIMTQPEAAA
jgi:hypothetical protein